MLRAEIARTRADLGDTVQAITARMDVPARAREAVGNARDQVFRMAGAAREQIGVSLRETSDAAVIRKPLPLGTIVAAAVVVGLAIYLVRRNRA
jgi:hypothetical protein